MTQPDPERSNVISWNLLMLKRFKKAYANAIATQKEEFIFDEREFFTGYAKYLIQYLEMKFKEGHNEATTNE